MRTKVLYLKHRIKILAKQKKYYLANREKRNQYSHDYYLKNKEKVDTLNRKWYMSNREKVREYAKKSSRKYYNSPQGYYNVIRKRCLKRKIDLLSKEKFLKWWNKQNKVCFYCGISENQLANNPILRNGHIIKRLTIDKLDNKLSYIINNIVLACYRCNWIKSDILTVKEMKEIGKKYIKPKYLGGNK